QEPEPELGQAGQHAALVGNAGGQHPVESADPVGGDDDQAVPEVVNVTDLAVTAGITGNVALQQWLSRHERLSWLPMVALLLFYGRGRIGPGPRSRAGRLLTDSARRITIPINEEVW